MASISFARIAGTSTTYAGTNVYTQAPAATGTGTPTGQEVSDYYLLTVFTKPYLDAHTLSFPSWRYSYYVWFVFIGLFIIWSVLHQFGVRFGALGALWRSIAMRKISFGKHSHRKKQKSGVAAASTKGPSKGGWSTPTLAQLLGLAVLLGFLFVVSYVGPDYINPQECMFGGICGFHPVNGDSATNQYYRHKRALDYVTEAISSSSHLFNKRRIARYGWSPLTDPLLAGPNYTIDKNYWASGNRVGLIAYALLPLSVGLALKQWPMNPFATPFFTNLHIDKTAFWHRWTGRIVWILSTVHAGLWTKQLFIDVDPFNEPTWNSAWKWHRLAAGGAAYIALTLMVLLSFKPFRNRFYELFYYSHVLLVLIFLVTIVIHYQALQGWGLLAVCLWGLERLVRFSIWMWLNHGSGIPFFGEGRIGKMQFSSRNASEGGFKVHHVEKRLSAEGQRYAPVNENHPYGGGDTNNAGQGLNPGYGDEEWSAASRSTNNLNAHPSLVAAAPMPRQPVYAFGPGNDDARSPLAQPHDSSYDNRSISPLQHNTQQASNVMATRHQASSTLAMNSTPLFQSIPLGYALAQLLPGRVIKLTLHTPRHMNWKPGQHVQLTLPSVRWWQSHPYSIVNSQDMTEALIEQNVRTGDRRGSEIVLLMSVRKGFTRRLFKSICQKRRRLVSSNQDEHKEGQNIASGAAGNGVLIRAQTYLADGSAARVKWNDFSTVVLFAAGTGVTYTVSVLQHLCYMMAEKDAALRGEQPSWSKGKKAKKPTNVTRVRFVWVLRDYAHLAWIAPILRRCLDISDPARLRIDLFVTRDSGRLRPVNASGMDTPMSLYTPTAMMEESQGDLFRAPAPGFARGGPNGRHGRVGSTDSSYSDLSQTVVDSNEWPNKGYNKHSPDNEDIQRADQEDSSENADFSVTDMILFDGEDEHPTYEDQEMSRNIKKEGKLRRGLSRKKKNGQKVALPDNTGRAQQYHGLADMVDQGELSTDELAPPHVPRSHAYPPSPRQGSTYSKSYDDGDKDSFMASGMNTPNKAKRYSAADLPLLRDEEVGHFDMSEQDKEDLAVLAELARSGKPDLPGILDAEIEKSQGKIIVGCCGPKSLNNLLRNMVAKRISPSRIARGDARGNVELVTEDFFY